MSEEEALGRTRGTRPPARKTPRDSRVARRREPTLTACEAVRGRGEGPRPVRAAGRDGRHAVRSGGGLCRTTDHGERQAGQPQLEPASVVMGARGHRGTM